MNYQKIHDQIINRALARTIRDGSEYEKHHIVPKHEGGHEQGPLVLLTRKEHYIVHKLRYKFTQSMGNLLAYNLMRYGRGALIRNHQTISIKGGLAHHAQWRERDPIGYSQRQQKAGRSAGANSRDRNLGFHALDEEQKTLARDKGRATTVENKLGMFSNEFRRHHRVNMQKKVQTPNGVFESMTEAAEHYNISRGAVTYRVNNFDGWYIIGEDNE